MSSLHEEKEPNGRKEWQGTEDLLSLEPQNAHLTGDFCAKQLQHYNVLFGV